MKAAVKRSSWINHLPLPITRGLMRNSKDHANLQHPPYLHFYFGHLFEDKVLRRMKMWMSHRKFRMDWLNRKARRILHPEPFLGTALSKDQCLVWFPWPDSVYANGKISNAIYYNDYYLRVHQNSVLRACWDCYSHFYSPFFFSRCDIENPLGQDNNCPFASTDGIGGKIDSAKLEIPMTVN